MGKCQTEGEYSVTYPSSFLKQKVCKNEQCELYCKEGSKVCKGERGGKGSEKGREVSLKEIEKTWTKQSWGVQPCRGRYERRKSMDGKLLRLESSQELKDRSHCVYSAPTV